MPAPWACYALRGLRSIFPGPLELERVSLDRWTVAGAVDHADALPGAASHGLSLPCTSRAPASGQTRIGPRDFPPGFRPGFSPVTRAPGFFPAHNARPRRFPA